MSSIMSVILRKSVNACNFGYKRYLNIRNFSISRQSNIKVAICGANGGVGQPLSLLLRMSPLVNEIALYDINNPHGELADLSHIDSDSKVTAHATKPELAKAFEKADIIVITAGKARAPGMTRNDLLKFNANLTMEIVEVMASTAPKAMLCIVTNPVNSLVPAACETLRKKNVFDRRRVFGITTLDLVRASSFAAQVKGLKASELKIPVIGGHSGTTIVPLFSQCNIPLDIPPDKMKPLVLRVQNGGTEVVKAKKTGSATLSTGYAVARFVLALCRAINGESEVVECAMVNSCVTSVEYFSTPLLLGCKGVEENLGFGNISDDEHCLMETSIKELAKEIEAGVNLAKEFGKGGKGGKCEAPKKPPAAPAGGGGTCKAPPSK